MEKSEYIWFNGELVPWREAKLHVLSHGLHYASGVFEGERVYGGSEQLVVTLDDGSKRPLSAIMRNVMAMWERVLAEMSL